MKLLYFFGKLCFLASLLLVHSTSSAQVDGGFREWTQEKTGRTVRLKLLEKRDDNSSIRVKTEGGVSRWYPTESFSKADKEFIATWVAPGENLTCKVVASGKGWKLVKVVALAGPKPMQVEAHRRKASDKPLVKTVKAGQRLEFEYKAEVDYFVRAKRGKLLVEEESYSSKSGL